MKLKICGMSDSKNIREIAKIMPDYLGFIFYEKSPRYVKDPDSLFHHIEIADSITKVGVFVDESIEKMVRHVKNYDLGAVQLHGKEDFTHCERLMDKGIEVIKVFSVDDDFDFTQMEAYVHAVDYFLFDTKGKSLGGNGISFDWQIIEKYPFEVPFFLSGGIGNENIDNVRYLKHTALIGIDVNSKLEISPGMKDPVLVEQFKSKFDAIKDR